MDVENQKKNMDDQTTGQNFKPNNERISNVLTEGVKNISGEGTKDNNNNHLKKDNYKSKELERISSEVEASKEILLDNGENETVLAENGIDDTNILSESIVPVVIAPEEHGHRKEPLVPANSERQTSLTSAFPQKQASHAHKGKLLSGIMYDYEISNVISRYNVLLSV